MRRLKLTNRFFPAVQTKMGSWQEARRVETSFLSKKKENLEEKKEFSKSEVAGSESILFFLFAKKEKSGVSRKENSFYFSLGMAALNGGASAESILFF